MSWILYFLLPFLFLGLSFPQATDTRQNYVVLTDGLTGRQKSFAERRCSSVQRKLTYVTQKVMVPCVQAADGTVQQNQYPSYGDGFTWRQCERTFQRPAYTLQQVTGCCAEWKENADNLCVIPDNSSQFPMLCHNGGIPEKYNGVIRCLCQPGFHGFVCEKQGEYPAANRYATGNGNTQTQGAMFQNQMWRILTSMFLRQRNQQMAMLMSRMNNQLSSNPSLPPLPGPPNLPYISNMQSTFNQQRPKSFFKLLSNIYKARMMHKFIEEHPELRDQMVVLLASKIASNRRRTNMEESAQQLGYKLRNFMLDRKRRYAIAIKKLGQLINMKKMMLARIRTAMMYKMMQSRGMGPQYMPRYYQNKQQMLARLQSLRTRAMRNKFALVVKYKLIQNMMANRPEFREFIQTLQQRLMNRGEAMSQESTPEDEDTTDEGTSDSTNCVIDFDAGFKQCFANFGLDPQKALLVTQAMVYGRIPADEMSFETFQIACRENQDLENCLNTPVASCQGIPSIQYVSQNINRMFRVLDTVCQHVPQPAVNEEPGNTGTEFEQLPDIMECQNGGQTLFVEDRYVCTCPEGYTGTFCEMIDETIEDGSDLGFEQLSPESTDIDQTGNNDGMPGDFVDQMLPSDQLDQMMPTDQLDQMMPTDQLDQMMPTDQLDQMMPTDPFDQMTPPEQVDQMMPGEGVMPIDQLEQTIGEYPHAGPDMPIDTSYPDPRLQIPLVDSFQGQRGPSFTNCPTDIITLTVPSDSSVAQLPFQLDARDWQGTPLQWAVSQTGFQWSSHSVETVIATARDAAGRLTKCVFSVTVTDPHKPSFVNCPGPIETTTDKEPVTWPEVEATDNVGLLTKPKGDHKSGSTFPVGRTLVTFVAEDLAGNVEYCKFIVSVEKSVDGAESEKEVISGKIVEDKVKPAPVISSAKASKGAETVSTAGNASVDTMMIAMLSVAVGVLIIAIITAIIACACLKKRKKIFVIEKKPCDIPAISTNPPEYETKGIPPMFYEEAKGETIKGEQQGNGQKDADSKNEHLESSKI